jgi:toxin YoeB
MIIQFSSRGWDDYLDWQHTDLRMLKRINDLLKDISRSPHEGIGKPEPLRHALSGYWSRRINDEHRLVYRVEGDTVKVAQAIYHYE